MKLIEKFSMGTGDRFAFSAPAQLDAVIKAKDAGADFAIVWNKSNREHQTIHSTPKQTYEAGMKAVQQKGWNGSFHFDADHINADTVDAFLNYCDFFTLDVADFIGEKADSQIMNKFLTAAEPYIDTDIAVEGLSAPLRVTKEKVTEIAGKYAYAVDRAAGIYEKIKAAKSADEYIIEVSMDETDLPQTPDEIFFILLGLSVWNVPLQTFAPKFTGRFNKGVEYVGDAKVFAKEFEEDILVLAYAVKNFGLPESLKLSVHSGSDKFAIYPEINKLVKKHGCGLHLKTAGTSWLEEVNGLALYGAECLDFAKQLYADCLERIDELCGPYATVIDIKTDALPSVEEVNSWSGERYSRALTHNQKDELYNASFRQLIHVGYKVAAEKIDTYMSMLKTAEPVVYKCVTDNLYDKHMVPIFLV